MKRITVINVVALLCAIVASIIWILNKDTPDSKHVPENNRTSQEISEPSQNTEPPVVVLPRTDPNELLGYDPYLGQIRISPEDIPELFVQQEHRWGLCISVHNPYSVGVNLHGFQWHWEHSSDPSQYVTPPMYIYEEAVRDGFTSHVFLDVNRSKRFEHHVTLGPGQTKRFVFLVASSEYFRVYLDPGSEDSMQFVLDELHVIDPGHSHVMVRLPIAFVTQPIHAE